MARFAGMKFSRRRNINVSRIIKKVVAMVLGLWVGSEVINALAVALNQTTSIFATGLSLLGFGESAGTMDGTVSSTGLLSVLGIIAAVSVVGEFIQVG